MDVWRRVSDALFLSTLNAQLLPDGGMPPDDGRMPGDAADVQSRAACIQSDAACAQSRAACIQSGAAHDQSGVARVQSRAAHDQSHPACAQSVAAWVQSHAAGVQSDGAGLQPDHAGDLFDAVDSAPPRGHRPPCPGRPSAPRLRCARLPCSTAMEHSWARVSAGRRCGCDFAKRTFASEDGWCA
jgi:hypothetical protein